MIPAKMPDGGPLPFWPGPTKSKTCATKDLLELKTTHSLHAASATSTLPPIIMMVVKSCFQGLSVVSETSINPVHDVPMCPFYSYSSRAPINIGSAIGESHTAPNEAQHNGLCRSRLDQLRQFSAVDDDLAACVWTSAAVHWNMGLVLRSWEVLNWYCQQTVWVIS